VNGLVRRYGVTLVRERAVLLLDAVGFSLHPPLEQVAMLNSLSYSVNSAYRQLISEDVQINFARSSTGDGFYIWNRAQTHDANLALYKLMMLILADNAVARRKAKRFPVPQLRAAFHVGEHYEFCQVEALNPTTFSYIVGHVTIELSRIVEKARPGQVVLGDFTVHVPEPDGSERTIGTVDFVARAGRTLQQLQGLSVANDRITDIRCYVTGRSARDGGFEAARYWIEDKHGLTRPVYNAKLNIHVRDGAPIYLGLQHKELDSIAGDDR
jgi:class 3 adenylate cyclase